VCVCVRERERERERERARERERRYMICTVASGIKVYGFIHFFISFTI